MMTNSDIRKIADLLQSPLRERWLKAHGLVVDINVRALSGPRTEADERLSKAVDAWREAARQRLSCARERIVGCANKALVIGEEIISTPVRNDDDLRALVKAAHKLASVRDEIGFLHSQVKAEKEKL